MNELELGRYTLFLKKDIDDKYQDILDSMLAAFSLDDEWQFGYGQLGELKQFAMVGSRNRNFKKWELKFKLDNFNTIKHTSFVVTSGFQRNKEVNIESTGVSAVLDKVHEFFIKYIEGNV